MSSVSRKWEFRGGFVPGPLWDLARNKQVSITDLLLLSVVGSLVVHEDKSREVEGWGCWASNDYLANAVDRNSIQVSSRISYLTSLGILISITLHNQRYLELVWSRTAEERNSLPGVYGDLVRNAHEKAVANLATHGLSPTSVQVMVDFEENCGGVRMNTKGEGKDEPVPMKNNRIDIINRHISSKCGATTGGHHRGREKPDSVGECTNNVHSVKTSDMPTTIHDKPNNLTQHSNTNENFGLIQPPKRMIRYAPPIKVKQPPEQLYFDLEDLLTKSATAKTGRSYVDKDPKIAERKRMARAFALRKLHKSMNHPEDLEPIIQYYASHNIRNKRTGKTLIIYTPSQLSNSNALGWILDCMAQDGLTNVHLLTPEQEAEYNQKADSVPPQWETYYSNDKKDVHVYREYGVLWVWEEGKGKGYSVVDEDLYNDEPKVCYKNEEAEISVYRRMVTVRQGSKKKISDLRRYKEIYG